MVDITDTVLRMYSEHLKQAKEWGMPPCRTIEEYVAEFKEDIYYEHTLAPDPGTDPID